MFNIWIRNLGKCNEGELIGKRITLPCSEEKLHEVFVEIKIGYFDENGNYRHGYMENGNVYEEYEIFDYEGDYNIKIDKFANLKQLNEIASKIEKLEGGKKEELKTIINSCGCDVEEALEIVEEGNYTTLQLELNNNNSDEKVALGEAYVNQVYGGVENLPPEMIRQYFNFKSLGHDLLLYGYYIDRKTKLAIDID